MNGHRHAGSVRARWCGDWTTFCECGWSVFTAWCVQGDAAHRAHVKAERERAKALVA